MAPSAVMDSKVEDRYACGISAMVPMTGIPAKAATRAFQFIMVTDSAEAVGER